ncbi:MAG: poly-beta-1,6-N-acetyl-D-glucosamine N-deacetylase PgaB [Myxococcota bacterium]
MQSTRPVPRSPGRLVSRAAIALLVGLVLLPSSATIASPPRPRETAEKLTILSYHEIADPGEALIPQYAVTPTMFVRQMDWLRIHGFRFVSVDDVLADRAGRRPLPQKAVMITFDDGYRSVYEHAWPILKAWRIPAVIAVVGHWQEERGSVDFDGKTIARDRVLSWDQLREMHDSGLVEIGSHSFDLHRGLESGPQGNLEPAATTRRWLAGPKRYEDEASYRARVEADLVRSREVIHRRIGRTPRVIAWPYGSYNETVRDLAAKHGMRLGLTLDDGANMADTPLGGLRRILLESGMQLGDLDREIRLRNRNDAEHARAQKIVHVDLDYIYDPDPVQQEKNLSLLLERLVWLNCNVVYLQAYADPDGDGAADAVYFPSRRVPMRGDLFNRVSWQIQTRTQVRRVYAWMPMLAWRLPAGDPAAEDVVTALAPSGGDHLVMGYRRLSPFSARAREAIREIYLDLARSAHFNGLLFHDDVTLSDFEDASPFGLQAYRAWGLPGSVEAIRASDDLLGRWTILKINALDDFAKELADIVRAEQPELRTARNLYARVVQSPNAEVWYAQSLDNSLANYDFTAIMAMPYMEQAPDPQAFYRELVDRVKEKPGGLAKVVFELQAVDWRGGDRLIPSEELAATIRSLYAMGAEHVGYYPDRLFEDHPHPTPIRAALGERPDLPPLDEPVPAP